MNDTSVSETARTRDLFRRAQEAMLDMFRVAPGIDPNDVVDSVGKKMVESQKRAFDMMNGFARVWTDAAKSGASGPEAWRGILDDATRTLSGGHEDFDPKGLLEAWRQSGDQMLAFFRPWQEAATRSFSPGGSTLGLMPTSLPGSKDMLGFLTAPGFGLLREYQNRVGSLFENWIGYQQKDLEYRQALTKAWAEAFRRMTDRVVTMAREGKTFQQPRELLEVWIEVADEVFTGLFATDEFSRLQSEMLNASHQVRLERIRLSEDVLRANDLPTRSDVEEAHRAIHALRRELRATQRELAALKEGRSA